MANLTTTAISSLKTVTSAVMAVTNTSAEDDGTSDE